MRWDVQGLRALAVIAVVVDHLYAWPGGGFVGVDVFFVISGFLITGILVRRHESTGGIGWAWFYARRAKRILPASLLVLAFSVVSAGLTFNGPRAHGVRTDALWAALFGANWRFLAQSTDYFAAAGPVSPLQHFWSLSVEEQFYFVWPWLMVAVYALLLSRSASRRRAHVVIGVVLAVVSVASFAWALVETRDDAVRAYFDTFARVWELGLGALLAVSTPLLVRIPRRLRPGLAWAGLLGIVASLWVVSPAGFPAPVVALPVLSTALVIAAGTMSEPRAQQRFLWPLTNRVSNYVGDISYSLYLWHFPLIVLGASLLGTTMADRLLVLVTSLAVASFSYYFIEDPLRRITWTLRREHGAPRTGLRDVYGTSHGTAGLVALGLVNIALAAAVLSPPEPPKTFDVSAPIRPQQGQTQHEAPAQDRLSNRIAHALSADSWPSLTPTIDDTLTSPMVPAEDLACAGVQQAVDVGACTWGPDTAPRRAVMLGDSISMIYTPVLRTILAKDPDWSLTSVGAIGCPFVDSEDVDLGAATYADCEAHRQGAIAAINELQPDVIFVAQEPRTHLDGSPFPPDEWNAAVRRELAKLHTDAHLVFLGEPPPAADPAQCYTPGSTPGDCVSTVTSLWRSRQEALASSARAVDGTYIDPEDWFCESGYCPEFVGTTPVRKDDSHFTPDYGQLIVPAVAESLRARHVLTN